MEDILLPEILGTMMLTLLGCGVVANAILPKTKGNGGGWLLINFGWGFGVFAGVFVAISSGAHINPAVTLGLWANGVEEFGPGIEANAGNALIYIVAQLIGAFLGGVLAWASHKNHFDLDADPGVKLGVFSTGAELRNPAWNMVTEIVGTFVLVFVVIAMGLPYGPDGAATNVVLGPLAVALLVVGIGNSLGGPTGYAINPARDLGPRIAHAILPIPGKGSSDWGYSWIPIAGPVIGGLLGGLLAAAVY